MKIGPVDIGVPVLINVGGCAVAVIALFALWNKGAGQRHEAYYREKIMRGLSDGLPERQADGVNAALAFLKVEPNHIPAKLTLANTYAVQANYVEAKKLFEEVAKMPNVTSQEKAIALTAAGVVTFKAAPKEARGPAIDEAEKLFQAAIASDAEFTDAYANIALLQPYKNADKWHAAAEVPARAALDGRIPPSAEALEGLYRMMGMIQKEKNNPTEALKSFDAAQSIRPSGGGGSDQMRRSTKLVGVIQKGLSSEVRRAQILDLERSIGTTGDRAQQALTAIAMGVAWMELREDTDWSTNGYLAGVRSFNRAMEYDPKNRLGFQNLSALYDSRVEDLSKQLKGPVTGFNGVTPPLDTWKDGAKARRLLATDKNTLYEIRRVLKEHEELWRKFIEKGTPTNEEKVAAKLEMMIQMRRQAYTMDVDEEASSKPLLEKAFAIAKELETLDSENGPINFASGMLLLDMKRFGEANIRLKKAAEKGFKSPTLDKILAELGRKPEMIGARPADGQRWFGKRPLVSATLYSPSATDGFRAVELTHNGVPAPSMLMGSQVLYLPDASKLTDGRHQIQISVIEAISATKLQFPPLEFSIDRMPPSFKVSPDGGEVDGKAVFSIQLSDPTGVDLVSVRVLYRSADNSKNPTNREIVVSGRYKVGSPELNIKGNTTIPGESFKVTAGTLPMPPGAYVLDITAKDLSGNEMKASKGFQVK